MPWASFDLSEERELVAMRDLAEVLLAKRARAARAAEADEDAGTNGDAPASAAARDLWERMGRYGREFMHAAARLSRQGPVTVADLAAELDISVAQARSRKATLTRSFNAVERDFPGVAVFEAGLPRGPSRVPEPLAQALLALEVEAPYADGTVPD